MRNRSIFPLSLFLVSTLLLAGCGIFVPSDDYGRERRDRTTTTTRNKPGNTTTRNRSSASMALRQQIVADAESLIGTRYRYGGVNPQTGMDCSGLMNYVFQNVGISLRRSSREQVKDGVDIPKSEVMTGDLVFFSKGGQVFHVALITEYDGNNMYVVHSTSSKGIIRQEILHNSYWGPKISSYRNVVSW